MTLSYIELVIAFSIVWWVCHTLYTRLTLLLKGPLKYQIANCLQNVLYFRPLSIDAILKLDKPSDSTYETRAKGRVELLKRLEPQCEEGNHVTPPLVDCRFQKVKAVMPLFKSLEVKNPNKVISQSGSTCKLVNGTELQYLGCDAVYTLGQGFYRSCHDEISKQMKANETLFSPLTINPTLEKHADLILKMTKQEKVRYHLSGSEAVDSAIRDVKMSTGKKYIVRFTNAYHGHITSIANDAPNQIYLKEMSEESLKFIEDYHYLIAGVIVNPMQYFSGPNQLSPPGEKLTYKARTDKRVTRAQYSEWLHKLQFKCQYCSKYLTRMAFIMDDIYFALRTSELFSPFYFTSKDKPLDPDLLILGKGVAAGYPLSIVVGKHNFMNYYDKNYLLKVNRIVGTMSGYTMGIIASTVLLEKIQKETKTLSDMMTRFDSFVDMTNTKLEKANVPVRIKNFSNTFTILYLNNSIYNSLFVQYMMAEGCFFSSQSTGKFNLSNDWNEADLEKLTTKIVDAATKMTNDQFFTPGKLSLPQIVKSCTYEYLKIRYDQIMKDKHIDIVVSHNHPVNKFVHFWSSIMMIFTFYPLVIFLGRPLTGIGFLLLSQIIRQIGHFFYEKQDRDQEKLKFGHKDGSKKIAAVGVTIAVFAFIFRNHWRELLDPYHFVVFMAVMAFEPHFLEICFQFGVIRGVDWVLKIATDPFTDVLDFKEAMIIDPKFFKDFNFI